MKIKVVFTEQVSYAAEIRLTAAQVAAVLAAAGLDDTAEEADQHDAVTAWLKGESEAEGDDRWFVLFEDQRPDWPTGKDVDITIHERDLGELEVVDREGL